jgi:hypothetical protein
MLSGVNTCGPLYGKSTFSFLLQISQEECGLSEWGMIKPTWRQSCTPRSSMKRSDRRSEAVIECV